MPPPPARCFNRRVHARRTRPADQPHSPYSDPRSDPAPRERAALWLQRAAGNHAAAGLLTRQPDPKDKPTPKPAPLPGEAQAKKLAAQLPGKRDAVLTELGDATPDVRKDVDDAVTKLLAAAKTAKEREPLLLLQRCLMFIRHRPKKPKPRAGPAVTKEGKVEFEDKVAGGVIKVRTGVDAGLGAPTFSLTFTGDRIEDCHWLQFISREIVPQHADARSGEMVDEPPVAGRVERSAGFSYDLSTAKDAPVWSTDSPDKNTAFYEEGMDAVKRNDKELAMFDDPNARENLLTDAMKAKNQPVPAHAVSRAHFDTYLVRGMDVLYRVRLDLTWQITNGKADAAPQIVPHGEPMKGIRPAQLAKLNEQLGGKAELPDYLATADEKPVKAGTAKPATPKPATPGKPGAKRAVQRDGAFPAVRDIAPAGSLKASEWDPKTRSADTTVQQLIADVATLAGAGRIKGVAGTTADKITFARRRSDLKPGLNYLDELSADGETDYIGADGTFAGPKLPFGGEGTPGVAISFGPSAFTHDKAHVLAAMRHEMKHAEHFLLAARALESSKAKDPDALRAWVKKSKQREPDRTLILDRISGDRSNTELLAYTEGFVTTFHLIGQPPAPKLMTPGYPAAIFELKIAGDWWAKLPKDGEPTKAALARLREYCRDTLSDSERKSLVQWLDYLLTYAVKQQPPLREGEENLSGKLAWSDFKDLGPFLKEVKAIALKP